MERKWLIGVVVLQAASVATIVEMSYRLHTLNIEQADNMRDAAALGCDMQTQDTIKKLASEQRFEFDDLRRRVIATNEAARASNDTAHSINRTMLVEGLTHR